MAIRKWMLNWPAYKNRNTVNRMKMVVKGRHWIGDRYNLFCDWFFLKDDPSLNQEVPF